MVDILQTPKLRGCRDFSPLIRSTRTWRVSRGNLRLTKSTSVGTSYRVKANRESFGWRSLCDAAPSPESPAEVCIGHVLDSEGDYVEAPKAFIDSHSLRKRCQS
ncbi:PREDICTED: uncharacterized protein LOC101304538 [Fragaria vesca subsp. vesca]